MEQSLAVEMAAPFPVTTLLDMLEGKSGSYGWATTRLRTTHRNRLHTEKEKEMYIHITSNKSRKALLLSYRVA
jgi:hypothetical protein